MNSSSHFSLRFFGLLVFGFSCFFNLSANAQPVISATQDDGVALGARKLRGQVITNNVVITNSGSASASGVTITGATPANTAEVGGTLRITPIALDDTYVAVGNTVLGVGAAGGVLTNDYDPDGVSLTVKAGSVLRIGGTAAPGGALTIAADGSFTYTPGVGALGTDIFQYIITDAHGQDSVTPGFVTFNMTSRVWYVQNASVNGNGLSTTPFNSLASAGTAATGTNDIIYVFSDLAGNAKLNGNIVLDNFQRLFGQGNALTVSGLALFSSNSAPTLTHTAGNIVSVAQSNIVSGLVLSNRTGSAIIGSSFGSLTISNLAISGSGQALNLNSGILNATIDSLSSSAATNGISLTGVNGTLSINAGILTGLVGSDFYVSGGAANISFAGSIVDTAGGRAVEIQNRTGGSVTFTGSITNSGAGILVQNNSGNTITFSNTIGINSGGNPGFSVSGSGTVTANNAANTIVTTTGTGLSVVNTTIGAAGLRFRNISVNGAANGIVLNNTGTSGGLTITGDGTTLDSGGILQNTTGHAITVTGGGNVNLSFMRVYRPATSGFLATDLNGINVFQKCVFDYANTAPAGAYAFRVANNNVNSTITLEANTFQNKLDGTTAVSISALGSSQITFNVQDSNTGDSVRSLFTNLFGSGIVVGSGDDVGSTANVLCNVSNSRFVNAPANGLNNLEMGVSASATLVPTITNNFFDRVALPLAVVGVINVNSTVSGRLGNATTSANISSNNIINIRSGAGPTFAYDPAGLNGYYGVRVAVDNTSAGVNHKIKFVNNVITELARSGLYVSSRGLANDVNVLIQGNTIGTLANPVGHGNVRGVHLETQGNSTMKAQVANNTIVTKSSSGSNSSLHLRSGVDNGSTASLQATVTGNTLRNAGAATTTGRFRAQTLGNAEGLVGAAGNICLDLRSNTLEDNTRFYELIHNSTGIFNKVDSGNTGVVSVSGSKAIGAVASCPTPTVP